MNEDNVNCRNRDREDDVRYTIY